MKTYLIVCIVKTNEKCYIFWSTAAKKNSYFNFYYPIIMSDFCDRRFHKRILSITSQNQRSRLNECNLSNFCSRIFGRKSNENARKILHNFTRLMFNDVKASFFSVSLAIKTRYLFGAHTPLFKVLQCYILHWEQKKKIWLISWNRKQNV